MAISRFSSPASFNPTSQYIPIPVEYLQNTLQNSQTGYDLGQGETQNLLETIAKTKSLDKDKPLLQNISNAYENELNAITDAAHRDLGSSNYRNRLAKLSSHLRTNLAQGPLELLNSNYNTYQAYQKQVQDSKDYNPLLDSEYTNNNQDLYSGAFNSNGSQNRLKLGSINTGINLPEEADKIVKGINSISQDKPTITKDANGNDVIINDKGEFITPNKIKSTFRPAFINSPAYKQVIQKADSQERIAKKTGQDFDRNAYINNTVNDLENSVVSKYTLSKTSRNIDFHNTPEYQQDPNATPIYTPTRNGAALTNPNVSAPLKEPGGSLSGITASSPLIGYNSAKVGVGSEDLRPVLSKQQLDQAKVDFNTQVNSTVQRLKSYGFDFNKTSYIDAHNKAIKDLGNVTLPGVEIQPKQAEVYQQLLNNSKGSRLYNVGGKQLNINQIADQYDVKPEEIEVSPSLIHYDSVDPNQKGGNIEVTLHIKGKEYLPAITALNDNFTAETGVISEIGQNSIYKGQDTYTEQNPLYDPSKDSDIYTVTVPKKQYSAGKELPFETTVVIAPRNGEKPIKVPYNTFKEIYGSAAVKRLQNTINSNQTVAPKDLK